MTKAESSGAEGGCGALGDGCWAAALPCEDAAVRRGELLSALLRRCLPEEAKAPDFGGCGGGREEFLHQRQRLAPTSPVCRGRQQQLSQQSLVLMEVVTAGVGGIQDELQLLLLSWTLETPGAGQEGHRVASCLHSE